MGLIKKVIKQAIKIILIVAIVSSVLFVGLLFYHYYLSPDATRHKIRDIYNKVSAASGIGDKPTLIIMDDSRINAATNGMWIQVNQGLIDAFSYDQIAMVLGHELAHVHLGHTKENIYSDKISGQYAEAMADKVGAFYMMRAGFDVCDGREAWKKIRLSEGNRIDTTHPNYSYRYDELNVGCE